MTCFLKINNPVGLPGRRIHLIFIKIFPFHVSTNVMYIDELVRRPFEAKDGKGHSELSMPFQDRRPKVSRYHVSFAIWKLFTLHPI